MLGLPATTEVNRRLPKEAFYRHMEVDAKMRRDLIDGVERIVVANSIKPATCNVTDGSSVHEILVVEIEPKGGCVPERAVRLVSAATPNKALVVDGGTGEVTICDSGRTLKTDSLDSVKLNGFDLDMVWSSMVAQVALGEYDGKDVWARIDRREKIDGLRADVAALEVKTRKERQVSRKNELFAQMKRKQAELRELEEE